MARKCKTPEKIREVLKRHEGMMDAVSENIHVKLTVPVKNQAGFIQEHSVDYFEGLAMGANMMMEGVLFEHNCYAGYNNIGEKQIHPDDGSGTYTFTLAVGPTHPEFKEWRRIYFTRGL